MNLELEMSERKNNVRKSARNRSSQTPIPSTYEVREEIHSTAPSSVPKSRRLYYSGKYPQGKKGLQKRPISIPNLAYNNDCSNDGKEY